MLPLVKNASWMLEKLVVSTEKKHSQFNGGCTQRDQIFLNVAGFGANGEVVRRANSSNKRLQEDGSPLCRPPFIHH